MVNGKILKALGTLCWNNKCYDLCIVLWVKYAYDKKHCSGTYIGNIMNGLYKYQLKEFLKLYY